MSNNRRLNDLIELARNTNDHDLLRQCVIRIEDELIRGHKTNDEDRLLDAVTTISLYLLGEEEFCEDLFGVLLALMERSEFLESRETVHLLSVFETEWAALQACQRDRLLHVLERTYSRHSHWLSWFMMSDILGQYFNDARAIEVLCRLRTSCEEGPRQFVPHGFEHIVTDSNDPDLAKRAMGYLLEMKKDPSEIVRNEVEESMGRIEKHLG